MKAIRVHQFGGPEVLTFEDLEIPVAGPGQVLVKIMAVGVNPVETYLRSGTAGRRPQLPTCLGQDAAGIIHALGSNVTNVKVGDRVFTSGTLTGSYAQYCLCKSTDVHKLPDNITFDQGACLFTPVYTAYHALYQVGNMKPGEFVLVHGASGGVGLAAVQLAASHGARVIGTASSAEGQRLVKEAGAEFVISHKEEGYMDKIVDYTGGKGVDLILEMLANANLGKDLPILALRGRVLVIGSRGAVQIDPRDTMRKRASIHGVFLSLATETELLEMHAAIGAALSCGRLTLHVGTALPLQSAQEAHKMIINPSDGANGKIVLHPW